MCIHVLKEFSHNSSVSIQFRLLLRFCLQWHPRTMPCARGNGRRQNPRAWQMSCREEAQASSE